MLKEKIKELIGALTLEEKASLCSGKDTWHTKAVDRLGIPSIMMTDGPHGLRKQENETDIFGIYESVPATCFPSGAALACSWDRELLEKLGNALGEESLANDIAIVLGPAVNIKRSPLCGRNFEYYSEDPYLTSEIAACYVDGVQEMGVGTSLKHYAANNMESCRMTVDTVVDERTLREIYLASFESVVKRAQPWTVMCAYNKVNGEYMSQNEYLLKNVLKDEWGLKGFIVSDWGAVDERAKGLAAGLDLEMPYSNGKTDREIVEAVKNGTLAVDALDQAVERILTVVFKAVESKKKSLTFDKSIHHGLAREIEAECMVLLKNNDAILPLSCGTKIAVIGGFAIKPRYQGGGSSHIVPTEMDVPLEEIKKLAESSALVTYCQGYRMDEEAGAQSFINGPQESQSNYSDAALIDQAKEAAAQADVAVIFAGLPESCESEGFDRRHMEMPESHNMLIDAVAGVQKNIVVVLSNGSPVEMPWADHVKGIVEGYLGGQGFGSAAASILYGKSNPCGKLAESFPKKLSDNPSYLNFPAKDNLVEYREGIFVGYRYYDKKEIAPLSPFGHGLSYTTFEYESISVLKEKSGDCDTLTVTISVKNTGARSGREIVQLYVGDDDSSVVRPVKELRGFQKVSIDPGETKVVEFVLEKRDFAFYDTALHDWCVESGTFTLYAGGSSACTPLVAKIDIQSAQIKKKAFTRNSTLRDILENPKAGAVLAQMMPPVEGQEVNANASMEIPEISKDFPLRFLGAFMPALGDQLDLILEKLNSL